MNNAIYIVFDDQHKQHARACLNSIEKHYPDHPTIIVVYDGHDEGFLEYLQSIKRVRFRPYRKKRLLLKFPQGISSSKIFAKLDLWSNSFHEFDDILYLDADTLILKPLDKLFQGEFFVTGNNIPFKEARVFNPKYEGNKTLLTLLLEDNLHFLADKNDMCNAGVFVIPRKYRTVMEHRYLYKIISRYNEYISYADQSIISIWSHLKGIRYSEEYQYNFQVPLFDKLFRSRYKDFGLKSIWHKDISFLDNIHILHFSGPRKPTTSGFKKWPLLGRYGQGLSDLFYSYLHLG